MTGADFDFVKAVDFDAGVGFLDAVDFDAGVVFLEAVAVLVFGDDEDFDGVVFFAELAVDFVDVATFCEGTAVFFAKSVLLLEVETAPFFVVVAFFSDVVEDCARTASLKRKHAKMAKMEMRSDWAEIITKLQRLAA